MSLVMTTKQVWMCFLTLGITLLTAYAASPRAQEIWFNPRESTPPNPLLLEGNPFPVPETAQLPPFSPRRSFYIQAAENSSEEVQKTLTHLKPGDQLILEPGIYEGPFHIDAHCQEGTKESPIEILAAKGAIITVSSPDRFKKFSREEKKSPLLTIERSGWRISNLEINAQNGMAAIGIRAKDILIQNCHVHDGRSSGIIIGPQSKNVTITGCQIHHFIHPEVNKDAHGIMIHAGTNNIQIINNAIYSNSGDSIQVIGPEQSEKADEKLFSPAQKIFILANLMHDDRENAVDIKSSRDITIRSNRIYGYRPSRTSNGEGIIVHYDVENVLIEGNYIADTNLGVVVNRGSIGPKRSAGFPKKITIQRNFIEGTGQDGILTFDSHDVKILNNIVSGFASGISVKGKPPQTQNITVENNIVDQKLRSAASW